MIWNILTGVDMSAAEDIGITIEELEAIWAEDVEVDQSQLAIEWVKWHPLQTKYRKMFSRENLRLVRMESNAAVLLNDKIDHYTQGGSKETFQKGWTLPPIGKVLKKDVERFLAADQDIIKSNLAVAYQKEKVSFLKDIVNMCSDRQWQLKGIQAALDYFAGGRVK